MMFLAAAAWFSKQKTIWGDREIIIVFEEGNFCSFAPASSATGNFVWRTISIRTWRSRLSRLMIECQTHYTMLLDFIYYAVILGVKLRNSALQLSAATMCKYAGKHAQPKYANRACCKFAYNEMHINLFTFVCWLAGRYISYWLCGTGFNTIKLPCQQNGTRSQHNKQSLRMNIHVPVV